MIALTILDQKDFMNRLLLGDIFDASLTSLLYTFSEKYLINGDTSITPDIL